jgi:diguanylate cyclase (GGDEF)-like protein
MRPVRHRFRALASSRGRHYSDLTAVNVYLAIGALGLVLLTALVAAVVVWRARATDDERVAEAIRTLAAGMQQTMRELAEAVETAQAVIRAERSEGELAAALDLDEVSERTLEAVTGIRGVEAVLLDAAAPGGTRHSATLGMLDEEAAKTAVRIGDNDNLRAIEVTYRYRIDDVDASSPLVRSSVVLPLRADGATIGSLSVFSRSSAHLNSDEELAELERVTAKAGPALSNARSYAEARALIDVDPVTGLHNRRYFHEMLAREIARAGRYERRLTVLVFDLDDFSGINARIGYAAGDVVLAEVAQRLLLAVREADVSCRLGGGEFAAVLPESTAEEGELLAGRIVRAVAMRPVGDAGTLSLSAGVAELRPGEGASDLFQRAADAVQRAKARVSDTPPRSAIS